MITNTVWVCGLILESPTPTGIKWRLVGIFDGETAEEKAVACCRTKWHFVGPFTMNTDTGDEHLPWPGGRYPLAKPEDFTA